MKFTVNSASATVRPLSDKTGLLMNVRAHVKNQGDGTLLMQTIIGWADEQGWLLYLEARVFEVGGIPDNKALAAWYARFGFAPTHQPREMRRYPREIYTSSIEKDELTQPG